MMRCIVLVAVAAVVISVCDAADGDVQARVQQEKMRLLEKLGLDDRPGNIDTSRIPQHLIRRLAGSATSDEESEEEPVGDWLIPAQSSPKGLTRCETAAGLSAACFWFRLPNDLRSVHVAELAITVDADHTADEGVNHTLVVSEVRKSPVAGGAETFQIGTVHQVLDAGVIVRIDITRAVAEWVVQPSTDQRILQVVCTTCSRDVRPPFTNWDGSNSEPVLRVEPERLPTPTTRQRRSHVCLNDGSCCLTYFYMNFTEIGWDDWIIQPKGYEANYCTGNCRLHQQNQLHSKLLRTIAYTREGRAEQYDEQMIPCCAPKRFSPLRIIYAVGPNDIRTKKVNGMKALECGC